MPTESRESIIARARELRAGIQSIFDDAAHWNRTHPHEEPINPDPDGQLKRCAYSIDRMLAAEG